jgi:hypothetical protein
MAGIEPTPARSGRAGYARLNLLATKKKSILCASGNGGDQTHAARLIRAGVASSLANCEQEGRGLNLGVCPVTAGVWQFYECTPHFIKEF